MVVSTLRLPGPKAAESPASVCVYVCVCVCVFVMHNGTRK